LLTAPYVERLFKGLQAGMPAANGCGRSRKVLIGLLPLVANCPKYPPVRPIATKLKWHPGLTVSVGIALLYSWSIDAMACSVCGCGDPLLVSSDPAAMNGMLRLQLDSEYLRVNAGNDQRPGLMDQLTQWSFRLNVAYRPIESLSFTITVPVLDKTIHTVGGGNDETASALIGLGDLELAGRFAFLKNINLRNGRANELAVTLGSSIPTGRYNARATDGTLVDPHGQIGTGAWGPFAGLNYVIEQGHWLGFASVTGRVRTTARYFDGSKYQFGNAVYYSIHGQYRLLALLSLDIGLDARTALADKAIDTMGNRDNHVSNTGGTLLSVAPGAYVNPVDDFWFFLRAQVPVYKHLFGEQNILPSFTAGVQYQIL
jgi:hypothetical protein